jgi:hypothetical protein
MFSLAKERMETTQLWKIIRKMPKGALLHAHMDAMVDLDFLFSTLLATPGIHIHCHHGLSTEQEFKVAAVKFRYIKSEKSEGPASTSPLASHILMSSRKQHVNMEQRPPHRHSCSPYKGGRFISQRRKSGIPHMAQEPQHDHQYRVDRAPRGCRRSMEEVFLRLHDPQHYNILRADI